MRYKPDDHPEFYDRGRQQNGETACVKVNATLANEKQAIDKHSCFKAMREQCRNSLQHWNVYSHNQLLGAFAQKIGDIQNSVFVVTELKQIVQFGLNEFRNNLKL